MYAIFEWSMHENAQGPKVINFFLYACYGTHAITYSSKNKLLITDQEFSHTYQINLGALGIFVFVLCTHLSPSKSQWPWFDTYGVCFTACLRWPHLYAQMAARNGRTKEATKQPTTAGTSHFSASLSIGFDVVVTANAETSDVECGSMS